MDIKKLVEQQVDANFTKRLEEGSISAALDYLASSADDPLQKKFLTHLTTHLKKMLDPDFHIEFGTTHDDREKAKRKKEMEDSKKPKNGDDIREEEAPASYKKALDKTIKAMQDSRGDTRTFFEIFGNIFDGMQTPKGEQMARQGYATQDYDFVSEEVKKKRKKKSEVTPVIINPNKTEI